LSLLSACDDNPMTAPAIDLSYNADLSIARISLADTTTLTNCLAEDANNLYWTESSDTIIPDAGSLGRLMKVSKMGGTPMMLVDAVDSPGCAITDSDNVYVTRGSDILKVPLAGGAATPIAQNQHVLPMSTPRLAAQGGMVYWITDVYGAVDAFNGKNAMVRVSSSGGGTVEVLFNDVTGSPGGIAVDAANAYYSDLDGMWVRPLAGGGMKTGVGVSSIHSNRFAVDSMHIVLDEVSGIGGQDGGTAGGDVALFKLDGSGRVMLSMMMATALTIDGSGVYANSSGQLTRFSLDGKMTSVLDIERPRAIALDAQNVYYTNGAQILRLAK
jgi:hypothetical protein